MEEKNKKNKVFEVPCPQMGTVVCPKPKECDGIHRLCAIPENHSGR